MKRKGELMPEVSAPCKKIQKQQLHKTPTKKVRKDDVTQTEAKVTEKETTTPSKKVEKKEAVPSKKVIVKDVKAPMEKEAVKKIPAKVPFQKVPEKKPKEKPQKSVQKKKTEPEKQVKEQPLNAVQKKSSETEKQKLQEAVSLTRKKIPSEIERAIPSKKVEKKETTSSKKAIEKQAMGAKETEKPGNSAMEKASKTETVASKNVAKPVLAKPSKTPTKKEDNLMPTKKDVAKQQKEAAAYRPLKSVIVTEKSSKKYNEKPPEPVSEKPAKESSKIAANKQKSIVKDQQEKQKQQGQESEKDKLPKVAPAATIQPSESHTKQPAKEAEKKPKRTVTQILAAILQTTGNTDPVTVTAQKQVVAQKEQKLEPPFKSPSKDLPRKNMSAPKKDKTEESEMKSVPKKSVLKKVAQENKDEEKSRKRARTTEELTEGKLDEEYKVSNESSKPIKKQKVEKGKRIVTVKEEVKAEVEKEDFSKRPSHYSVKCRAQSLVEVMTKFGPEKKRAVIEVGFGGLLHMSINQIPSGLTDMLVDVFDHESNKVKVSDGQEFILSQYDVHDIFLLPVGGKDVVLTTTGRGAQEEDTALKKIWRERFKTPPQENISLKVVSEWLKDHKGPCDDVFKQAFVLYAMSTFLAPRPNHSLDFQLLKAVDNVHMIKHHNWSKYVFDKMVEGIKLLKKGAKNLSGCIVVLILAYLQRFEFKKQNLPTTLPLIRHWTESKLTNRVKEEAKLGCLGSCEMSETKYPICNNSSAPFEVPEGDLSTDLETERDSQGRCKIVLEMFCELETDEDLKQKAVDDAHLMLLLMKRDSDFVHQAMVQRFNDYGNNNTAESALTTDQRRYVDDVLRKAESLKRRASDFPVVKSSKKIKKSVTSVPVKNQKTAEIEMSDSIVKGVLESLKDDFEIVDKSNKGVEEGHDDMEGSDQDDNNEVQDQLTQDIGDFNQEVNDEVEQNEDEGDNEEGGHVVTESDDDSESENESDYVDDDVDEDDDDDDEEDNDDNDDDVDGNEEATKDEATQNSEEDEEESNEDDEEDDEETTNEDENKDDDKNDETGNRSGNQVDNTEDEDGEESGEESREEERGGDNEKDDKVRNGSGNQVDNAEEEDGDDSGEQSREEESDGDNEVVEDEEVTGDDNEKDDEVGNGSGNEIDNTEEEDGEESGEQSKEDESGCDNEVVEDEEGNGKKDDAEADNVEYVDSQCSKATEGEDEIEVDILDNGSDEALFDNYDEQDGDDFLFHVNRREHWMLLVDPFYGCTLDCNGHCVDVPLLSSAMIAHEDVISQLLHLRKEVVDYCMINDDPNLSHREVVFGYGRLCLTRKDTITLCPEQLIGSQVLDAWSMLMNEMIIRRLSSNKPSRIYMGGLAQNDYLLKLINPKVELREFKEANVLLTYQMWSDSLDNKLNFDSDMIYLPLSLDQHFFGACINFKEERVEYLDNQPYFARSKKVKMARIAANTMGKYMSRKGVKKGDAVVNFPIHNNKFKWQNHAVNNDSGVFQMLLMAFYTGDVLDCGLGDAQRRILYRAEICAILVLSDINAERSQLTERVISFRNIREETKTRLLQKRKVEAQLEQENLEKERQKEARTLAVTMNQVPKLRSAKPSGNAKKLIFVSLDDDSIGCSLNCGLCDRDLLIVSEFIKQNSLLLATTSNLRRDVLDYAFLDDELFEKSEVLAAFGGQRNIKRSDIMSLHPKCHTNPILVECWSLLLNDAEMKKKSTGSTVTRKLYLGLGHMELLADLLKEDSEPAELMTELFQIWDKFIKDSKANEISQAHMIFVPCLVENHCFCVCIDFIRKHTCVIDNRTYMNFKESVAYTYAQLITAHMSDYMTYKGDSKGSPLVGFPGFPMVPLVFDGQSSVPNDKESATMVMTVVSNYEGRLLKSDLVNLAYRRVACTKVVVSLLLADVNLIRADLLENVHNFSRSKKGGWTDLETRRLQFKNCGADDIEKRHEEDLAHVAVKKLNTELPVLRIKFKKNTS